MYFHFFIIKFHYLIFNYQNQTMIRFLIILSILIFPSLIPFFILISQILTFITNFNYLYINLINQFHLFYILKFIFHNSHSLINKFSVIYVFKFIITVIHFLNYFIFLFLILFNLVYFIFIFT